MFGITGPSFRVGRIASSAFGPILAMLLLATTIIQNAIAEGAAWRKAATQPSLPSAFAGFIVSRLDHLVISIRSVIKTVNAWCTCICCGDRKDRGVGQDCEQACQLGRWRRISESGKAQHHHYRGKIASGDNIDYTIKALRVAIENVF
jgi:hypothetical protein